MKSLITVIFFFGISYITFTQEVHKDTIYLKDGTIIQGKIIEQIPDKSVKIETTDNLILTYQQEEVEKITKGKVKVAGEDNANKNGLKPGYKGIIEIGYGIPSGDKGASGVKVNFVNGIQFNSFTSLGIGVGLFMNYEGTFMPVFADFRLYPLNKKATPYFAFNMGYSFGSLDGYSEGGYMWSILCGLNLNLSRYFSMHLGISYDSQKYVWSESVRVNSTPQGSYRKTETHSGTLNAVLINLGFSF
jgi:hypothetical protein